MWPRSAPRVVRGAPTAPRTCWPCHPVIRWWAHSQRLGLCMRARWAGMPPTASMPRRLSQARLVRRIVRPRVSSRLRLRYRQGLGQCPRPPLWPSRDALRASDLNVARGLARKASGRCCAVGCAHIGAFHKRNSRSTWASSSSCTTSASEAKRY